MICDIRHDWTTDQVATLYELPLTELVHRAQSVHRRYHDPAEVQRCTLLTSRRAEGCPEDCAYCPQSARYETGVELESLLSLETVVEAARQAKASGSTRFCMGAAWREVRDGESFERVLAMMRAVASLDLEVCATLGMLTAEQARRLEAAGLGQARLGGDHHRGASRSVREECHLRVREGRDDGL